VGYTAKFEANGHYKAMKIPNAANPNTTDGISRQNSGMATGTAIDEDDTVGPKFKVPPPTILAVGITLPPVVPANN
jgi:hypothetical protein